MRTPDLFGFGRCLLFLFYFVSACLVASCGEAAIVTGIVLDGSGKPVVGAIVTIQARPPFVVPRGDKALTDSAGAFRFADVSAGTHELCAIPTDPTLVSSCAGAAPLKVNLVAVPTSTSNITRNITVTRGRRLTVRVHDPQGLVQDPKRRSRELQLYSEIEGSARVPMILKSQTGSVYTYETIAASSRAAVNLVAPHHEVSDDRGLRVQSGQPTTLQSGTDDVIVNYTIRPNSGSR